MQPRISAAAAENELHELALTDSQRQLVKQRLQMIRAADLTGNVAEACRQMGCDRTRFYRYRNRFAAMGVRGLVDQPRVAKSNPRATPPEVVEQVERLSLEHPAAGCDKLAKILEAEGTFVSAVTVQKHLVSKRLGTRLDRAILLERHIGMDGDHRYTSEQIAFVEHMNPCFAERRTAADYPGQRIVQGMSPLRVEGRAQRRYLHYAIDRFSNYAFCELHETKGAAAAISLLHQRVLPFFEDLRLQVEEIATDAGRDFHGGQNHPYSVFLRLYSIRHLSVASKVDGYLAKFRTGFVKPLGNRIRIAELREIHDEIALTLSGYNLATPLPGFPNHGETPAGRIRSYLEVQHKEIKKILNRARPRLSSASAPKTL